MNRKAVVLLIIIGALMIAVITITQFPVMEEQNSETQSKIDDASETKSEAVLEQTSETKSEPDIPITPSPDTDVESENGKDKNGDIISQSKYLDDDGDTVANYYDICPGYDDFSDSDGDGIPDGCDQAQTSDEQELDDNGDLKSQSKYLDDDGDTVANYYDICPGYDDFADSDGDGVPDDCQTNVSSLALKPNNDQSEDERDDNGDLVSESKYLDSDGDTVANYYDVCPGYDDFADSDGNGVADGCDY